MPTTPPAAAEAVDTVTDATEDEAEDEADTAPATAEAAKAGIAAKKAEEVIEDSSNRGYSGNFTTCLQHSTHICLRHKKPNCAKW